MEKDCSLIYQFSENMKTTRSHSGILIYENQAPIVWYSKRQNTVEASSFGSEYIALRICTEMVEALHSLGLVPQFLRG